MARADTLDRAYKAIARLQAQGRTKLNASLVAASAGLARSTLYLDDDDWMEVLKAIRGETSPSVGLAAVEVVATSKADDKLRALAQRVEDAEEALKKLHVTAHHVYRQLLDQVQYYCALAGETPWKWERDAQTQRELNTAKQELQRLNAENNELRAQMVPDDNGTLCVTQNVIELSEPASLTDMYTEFLNKLAGFVPDAQAGQAVGAIYLLCGLPLSGRSTWIRQHKPLTPRLAVYVDGTNHRAEVRSFFIQSVRRLTEAPIHCVRLRAPAQICLQRCERGWSGAAQIKLMARVEQVQAEFQEVKIDEPFNSVILA